MYKIIFEDSTEFLGGEIQDSRWNTMPNKPIKKLIYNVGEKEIVLEGYDSYNHLVERISIVGKSSNRITQLYLMAKKDDNVLIISIDPVTNKFRFDPAIFGREYYNKATTGWKSGISSKPTCKIN